MIQRNSVKSKRRNHILNFRNILIAIIVIILLTGGSTATSLIHPVIAVKLIGPTGTLAPDTDYTFLVWLVNQGIFSFLGETGKNAKIDISVTGASITEGTKMSFGSYSSNTFTNSVIQKDYALVGAFKVRTPQTGTFTITANGQATDIDSGFPDYNGVSSSSATLSYTVKKIGITSNELSDLAWSRAKVTDDYFKMYSEFIVNGNPYGTTDQFKISQDLIQGTEFATNVVEAVEVGYMTTMIDPAIGIYAAFNNLIVEVFDIPTTTSFLELTQFLIGIGDRRYTYHMNVGELADNYPFALTMLFTPDPPGKLNNYITALESEQQAWKANDYAKALDSLNQEESVLSKALVGAKLRIDVAKQNKDQLSEALFTSMKSFIEQEQVTVSKLKQIASSSQVPTTVPPIDKIKYAIILSSSPEGLSPQPEGGGAYAPGQTITVTAQSIIGYTFQKWTENGVLAYSKPSYSFVVNKNRMLVAEYFKNIVTPPTTTNYAEIRDFTHTTGNVNPGDAGSASVTIQNTGTATRKFYVNVGYRTGTNGWTLLKAVQSSTMNSGAYETISFDFVIPSTVGTYDMRAYVMDGLYTSSPQYGNQIDKLAFNIIAPTTMTYIIVTSIMNAPPSTLAPLGAGTYTSGQIATVTAQSVTGYTFQKWTENGIQVSTAKSYPFTVTKNRNLVAVYTPNEVPEYTITVSTSPEVLSPQPSGEGTYSSGDTVTVTAQSVTGYTFQKWTENGIQVSTAKSYPFTVTKNRNLVAGYMQEKAKTPGNDVEKLLAEDFESYTYGTWPSSGGWEKFWNVNNDPSNNKVTDQYSSEGNNSLQIFGEHSGCWGAMTRKPVTLPRQFYIEASMMASGDAFTSGSCHSWAGDLWMSIGDGLGGTEEVNLFRFYKDSYFRAVGESTLSYDQYNTMNWYDIKMKVDLDAGTVDYWINNNFVDQKFSQDLKDRITTNSYIAMGSGGGRGWVDDIEVGNEAS
ncbi:MAG: hypothetical protein C3F06_14560 [Candidatus Methanoperedenaceae archaeon]|nr:MAG: hypothetical protein C3F06_14560 [Candidatus Methanoperedenaceae archaeon]